MLRMLRLLPLLMLETTESESEPDFFGIFSKMHETLESMNQKLDNLKPAETNQSQNNQSEGDDQNSPATSMETLSETVTNLEPPELQTPASTEAAEPNPESQSEADKVETESQPESRKKRYPWSKKR